MNFGDDPLADLSDGSNDSFFDEPKPTKRSSLSKTPDKKSITDIFSISDKPQDTPTSKRSDDWLGLDSKETKSPAKTSKVSKKISFEDDDDILGNLGFSKRPQTDESKSGKKIDLLESILGPTKSEEPEKKTTFDDILKESKSRSSLSTKSDDLEKKGFDDLFKDSRKSQSPALKSESSLLSEGPREGRRGRRSSGGLIDPLGLFNNEQRQEEPTADKEKVESTSKAVHSKSAPNISSDQNLPDWLGGTPVKESKSENIITKEVEDKIELIKVESEKPETLPLSKAEDESLGSLLVQQKLAQSNLEYQNTAIALQQQESQLLMALQMKKYEENLSGLQLKQQEVLRKQEEQFNLLLERQFAKQQIMENNMKLQQERINNHIQMLIAQPPAKSAINEEMKNQSEESEKLYEHIIDSLKQRQHEENFLLEESYKKQISLLEQSLEAIEKRLKFDVEKVSEVFEEKLKNLQQQHDEEIQKYKHKIQDLESQHSEEIKQIRENNSRIIEEIKYEHSTLLENIKETKKSETSLFQDSSSYLQKLDSNIEVLYFNSKSLIDLRDHIERDYGVLSKAREESLKAKEHEIIKMREALEKCRESAEKERAELLGLVRALETKIAEQNQNAREERWAFQQAASTLAARSAAMDRETEFNRASLDREREQLKTLRESILAEQEKMLQELNEEKLLLSAEKSRLEASAKLSTGYDAQKAKTEVEAALQVAKEATEMTDREREALQREKCEIEKLKRQLRDQEKRLNLKESELERSFDEAEFRKNQGERAISEAKTIENKYNERLRELQNQLVVLSSREKKLAEEKISLSRERLSLNTLIKQSKKCSLCEADPQKLQNDYNLNEINFSSYLPSYEQIDDELIRLRLEATAQEIDSVPK